MIAHIRRSGEARQVGSFLRQQVTEIGADNWSDQARIETLAKECYRGWSQNLHRGSEGEKQE
jgi:hypothetical protein